MNCLSADDIYLYIEGELSEIDVTRISQHLERCSACREALEDRQRLVQAAQSLSPWAVPQDFARLVLDRIFPARLSLGRAFLTAAAGTVVIVTSLLVVFLFSGLNLLNFLMSLNQSILNGIRDFAVLGAKTIKLLFLLVKVLAQFTNFIWESLARLSGLPSTELQAILVVTAALFTVTLYFGIKRLIPVGEKS